MQRYRNRIIIQNTFVPSPETGYYFSINFCVEWSSSCSKQFQGHFSSSFSCPQVPTMSCSFSQIWFPMNSTCFGLLACLDRIPFVFSQNSFKLPDYCLPGVPLLGRGPRHIRWLCVSDRAGCLPPSIITWRKHQCWRCGPSARPHCVTKKKEKEAIHVWIQLLSFFGSSVYTFCLLQCSPANSR